MIQRIQSVYLGLIVLLNSVIIAYVPLGYLQKKTALMAFNLFSQKAFVLESIPLCFIFTTFLALVSVLKFKNRKSQFMLNRIGIIVNLYLIGVLLFYLLNLSGETTVSEKGIGSFIPVLNVFLFVFANKAIQKDEALVKSMDRLR